MITIVDYGVGNLGSIVNMFKRVDVPVRVTGDVHELTEATKILLPGVGAFDHAIQRIQDSGLREILDRKALVEKIPVLGVCLGMQLMTRDSEEGVLPGLGWVDAHARRFPMMPGLKVPHMGWNAVSSAKHSSLTAGWPSEPRFYFVHSYFVDLADPSDRLLRAHHGIEFDAAFQRGNLFGAQFHPEKSHKFGMALFKNFGAL